MDSLQSQLEALELRLQKAAEQKQREALFIDAANIRFERNLKSFKNYFPEIYDKYLTYQPGENFDLIVNPNGTANIIDYNTKVPMYSEDPIAQVKEQVEKNLKKPIIGRVDHSSVVHIENIADFRHVDLMKAIGGVYNEALDALSSNDSLGASIPSLMIFGVGLGYHIQDVVSASRAGFINIFEPNEDYFFASLFVADWAEILKTVDENGSYLYLGIGLKEHEIYEEVYTRSKEIGAVSVCHAWFYQHYPSIEVNQWIDEFKRKYHQFFAGFGFFDDALIGIAHTFGNVKNKLPILAKHTIEDKIVSSLPALIVANGPSLDDEIEFIRSIQNDVIIFSCNSASTALSKHGIIPDFHVALERTELTYHFLKEHLPEEHRQKINLLVTNVMHPNVAELFKWSGAGLKPGEAGTQLFQLAQYKEDGQVFNTLSFCNPLVGNTALSFASHLGFSDIYLVGVDNGYIDENHHHSKSSYYYDKQGNTQVDPFKLGSGFTVPGNFGGQVITDEFMNVGNIQMERLLDDFKKRGVTCFNCSNGAKIKHTYPVRSSEVLIDKQSENHKAQVIDHIKFNKFQMSLDESYMEKLLAFEDFESFCGMMVSILEKPAKNRNQALDNLLESLRYLYSFRNSAPYLSLYLLVEGESLYVSTTLVSLLYNFGNDEEIMPHYNKALNIWIDFLNMAPDYYREHHCIYK